MSTVNIERAKKIKARIKELKLELYIVEQEVKKETNNKYYSENKDSLNKKIDCPCNGTYAHKNKRAHERSKLHIKYLQKLKETKKAKQCESDSSDSSDSDESD